MGWRYCRTKEIFKHMKEIKLDLWGEKIETVLNELKNILQYTMKSAFANLMIVLYVQQILLIVHIYVSLEKLN